MLSETTKDFKKTVNRVILTQSLICLTNWKMYRLMKYIVSAFWKHDTPINAEEAIDYMMIIRDTFDNEEHVLETIWYQIDEYTHGSVAIYKSEESYHALLEKKLISGGICS